MRRRLLAVIGAASLTAALAVLLVTKRSLPGADEILASHDDHAAYDALQVLNPINEALFPPEIVPPTFLWKDSNLQSNSWLISFEFQDGKNLNFLTTDTTWSPPPGAWQEIKARSAEKPAHVTILGFKSSQPLQILSEGQISLQTARYAVDAPLFYREVILPFADAVRDPSQIRWRFGPISSPEPPPVILQDLPVCGNCHSFSSNGTTLAMDVDYANNKGSYAIVPVAEKMVLDPRNIITWDDYRKQDSTQTFGLLSQISPDGRFVVSTVKDESVFVPMPDLAFSQLFFPIKGILCIYDRQTRTFTSLPGADNPDYVQSNPSWSPDGQYIVFARAKAYKLKNNNPRRNILLTEEECREFTVDKISFLFDLYRVPFNKGNGGTPQPLFGASNNGLSNYFAKYSPDGRWIVFCRARSYMLLQPDSQLFIIPAQGGEARKLRCNTGRMNSWHSWSPNSKWLVFSSKANSPYTQLFLTHIDDQGNSTPPVVLSHLTASDRAANIPEFVNVRPAAIKEIREQFVDDTYYLRAALEFLRADDSHGAERQCRKALEINPRNVEVLGILGLALFKQGELDEAVGPWSEAIRLDPTNIDALNGLGHAMLLGGKPDQAIRYWSEVVRLKPDHVEANGSLGSVLFAKGMLRDALPHLSKAVRLNPSNVETRYSLGQALSRQGRSAEATRHLSVVVRVRPRDAAARYELAVALAHQGKLAAAIEQWREVARLDPNNINAHYNLGQTSAFLGILDEAIKHWSEVVRLDPANIDALVNLETGYARTGRLREAVIFSERALMRARASGNLTLADKIEQRLRLYKQPTQPGHRN